MDRLLFRPARAADVAVAEAPVQAVPSSAAAAVPPVAAPAAPAALTVPARPAARAPVGTDPWAPRAAVAGSGSAAPGDAAEAQAPESPEVPEVVPTLGALWVGFSQALDLAEGQPEGHALRSAWIALHIGRSLGLESAALRQLCETVLLKDLGGSRISAGLSALAGVDDRGLKPRLLQGRPVDWVGAQTLLARGPRPAHGRADRGLPPSGVPGGARAAPSVVAASPSPAHRSGVRSVMPPLTPSAALAGDRLWQDARRLWYRLRHGGRTLSALQQLRSAQGAELARQLSLSEGVAHAIGALDEHWDGRGGPQGLPGEAIPLGARIALLAQQTERAFAGGGPAAALQLARRQSGRWFDPHLVQMLLLCGRDPGFWESLLDPQLDELLLADPVWCGQPLPDADHLDDIAATFGLVADAKSPALRGHSERVSALCDAMALRLGLPEPRRRTLRRAAALHDLGRLGVSSLLIERPGPLGPAELARVRQHVRHTRRLLSRIPGFEPLARLCGDHHERLDGSGSPCGLSARQLPLDARLLGVADLYDALVSPRPHRAALLPAQALQQLRAQADAGRLDGRCVEVLARVVRRHDRAATVGPDTPQTV